MRCRIHRGGHEIGGSCVEVEHDGQRLVIDLGLPLTASIGGPPPLPEIPGLTQPDLSLLGVVLSHGHPDHYGLAALRDPSVALYCRQRTAAILRAAAFFTPMGLELNPAGYLADRVPLTLGPFTVTPSLADHSAFDAYSLLIEAGGRKLFYTGDLRAHGRKRAFDRLVQDPPEGVHAVLMEGTSISRDPPAGVVTEVDVEDRLTTLAREAHGMVLVAYSAQNIDRLVSVYRAARRAGRLFVMDLYTATVARATGLTSIPQAEWKDVRVYVPRSQRLAVKRSGEFDRTAEIRGHRVFPEQLAAQADRLVMTFRGSMAGELEQAGCLNGAGLVWSMWDGYLQQPSSQRFRAWLAAQEISTTQLHTSGHATRHDLQRLGAALGGRIVPIHTDAPDRFTEIFSNVEVHADGQWWVV